MPAAANKLRSLVDDYFVRHPKATVPSLAKDSGLGASTVRRVLQGEAEPSLETAWAILNNICDSGDEIVSALCDLFPESPLGHLQKAFSNNAKPSSSTVFRDIVRTRAGFVVANIAASDCGISRERAVKIAGYEGERVINDLIEAELAIEDKGICRVKSFGHSDPRLTLDQIKTAAEVFDVSLAGTTPAGAMLKTSSVSAEAIAEIKAEFKRFVGRVMEISEDRRNSGDHPIFVTAMMNLLDSETYKGGAK